MKAAPPAPSAWRERIEQRGAELDLAEDDFWRLLNDGVNPRAAAVLAADPAARAAHARTQAHRRTRRAA